MTSPATNAPRIGDSPTAPVSIAARITTSSEIARNSSGLLVRAACANSVGSRNRPTSRIAAITATPPIATRPRLGPSPAPITNRIGTKARSSNNSIASAARPTALVVPAIGSTKAVDDIASATASQIALEKIIPVAASAAAISPAISNISAAPIPNTARRMANNRLKLSSSPIENSSSTIPKSANGSIPSGSVIVTAPSHGCAATSWPSPNGPATIPTRMKPITGLIFNRANAGITIPAAPRMVSVSDRPVGMGVTSIARPCAYRASMSSPRLRSTCHAANLVR